MKIVFSGAAGIGKTTTAEALADALQLPLLPENMKAQVDASQRWLEVSESGQEADRLPAWKQFLKSHIDWMNERAGQLSEMPGFVADRWTVDLLAQWLASGGSKRNNAMTLKLIRHFRRQASKIDLVVILPLRLDLVDSMNESNLPRSSSFSDQLQLHCLIRGLLQQLTAVPVFYVPPTEATVEERVKMIRSIINKMPQRKALAGTSAAAAASPGLSSPTSHAHNFRAD